MAAGMKAINIAGNNKKDNKSPLIVTAIIVLREPSMESIKLIHVQVLEIVITLMPSFSVWPLTMKGENMPKTK